MFLRLLMVNILILFLAGCATTGRGVNEQTQEFQNRITALETELEKKNQDISMLESELQRMQEQLPIQSKDGAQSGNAPVLSIRQIQTALKEAGFYKGVVDGKTGPQTKRAIKNFQKAQGLKADGISGKKTSLALSKYLQ